ncbi:putative T-complex protein 1 subunit zeta [Blattamonas nauphoetae]|uniref:T-complex protein 1 subunit zeta n=1 Tax=Blattamonas nauphoetae TaxID=2049346 RepID=A0ABQ9XLZ6_9EUKA|nr:putative T-complex protein 1 subunit zeta [Blattamonas nauphoetae]
MSKGTNRALTWNIAQAKGLQEVLKSNLGPTGTMKLLVSGGGEIRITKDGARLLSEMQIQVPTAQLIARSATAIDDEFGDGTSSVCLVTAEILKSAEKYLAEGVHPRVIVEGIKYGAEHALNVLDEITLPVKDKPEYLEGVVRTALTTKLDKKMAVNMTSMIVDALNIIKVKDTPLDLHMVEVMHMNHKQAAETALVRGLVLDHGPRHPDMPRDLKNCFILTCNVSLEYEKSEVNASFSFATPEQRDRLVASERKLTDEACQKIIALKRQVCKDDSQHFIVINQKGIDPLSLDQLAKEGIMGLRRAKKRNMERLALACGGVAVNSVDDLTEAVLGKAGHVYCQTLGEDTFTFIEDVQNPNSCTLLVKGSSNHIIGQVKDAIRDGLRAGKHGLEGNGVVCGGGGFELTAQRRLEEICQKKAAEVGKITPGIRCLADGLLVIPKILSQNSGFDAQQTVAQVGAMCTDGIVMGIDVDTGLPIDCASEGILDNACVKRQIVSSASVISTQLLLVDDVMVAGKAGTPTGPVG